MIDTSKDYGKLHLILELINRRDIRKTLNEKFDKEKQGEIFRMLRSIMADEISFVLALKETEQDLITH